MMPVLSLTPESIDRADPLSFSPCNPTSCEHRDAPSHKSLCSDQALAWLRARVVADDEQLLVDTVARLSINIQRKCTLDLSAVTLVSEPDAHTAWEYCQEFFTARADRFFGVVERQDFESRLRRHFDPTSTPDIGPGWFALRNTIYALGTRLLLSKRGHNPRVIHAQACRYFEAALSVLTKLLFSPSSDLTSIQALALMSFFAENILSSGVEYMLCSNAVRLAQAAGLHREQNSALAAQGTRIWWALYCYEKLISMRDGRPSCINDDDISCHFPQRGQDEDVENFTGFILIIQHAQVSSRVYNKLYSATACRTPEDHHRQAIKAELERALYQWRGLLPSYLRPGVPVRHSAAPHGMHSDNVVYSHYAFYSSIIAIHHNFPWTTFYCQSENDPSVSQCASESQEKVLSAARNIILATRYFDIDLNTTGCLVFAYPMLAVTVLFCSVMQNPMSPSAQSDVALLDMAAGHFAKLELATSMQVDVQFVRDIADIARHKINEVKNYSWAEFDFSTSALGSVQGSPPKTPEDRAAPNLNFMDFISDNAFSIPGST